MHRAFPQHIARYALAGVFGLALASKLRDPSGLMEPLRLGLGLDATAAGLLFVLVVCVLAACIGALVLYVSLPRWRGARGSDPDQRFRSRERRGDLHHGRSPVTASFRIPSRLAQVQP